MGSILDVADIIKQINGNKELMAQIAKADPKEEILKTDGYEVVSGPRTTGDGYYESCIVVIEGNQIEITV